MLELLLVDISIRVANDGWQDVVWQVWRLRQRNELWAQLSHTLVQCFLHLAEAARRQEACVVDGGAILEQLFEAVDLAEKVHLRGDTRISELSLLAHCAEKVELEVLKVCTSHIILSLVELFVIFHFG